MLNCNLKFYYRKLINKFSKYPIIYNNGFNLQKVLSYFKIDYVIDIGAYTGTYGQSLRRFGYRGNLLSFEPVKSNYLELLNNAKKDRKWRVHERVALGFKPGKAKLYVSKKKDSSSLLKIKKIHTKIEPDSKIVGKQDTRVETLDNIIQNYKHINLSKALLKIDTQGFEYEILQGSKKTLKKLKLVQVELSLNQLYKNQKNKNLIIELLEKNNFECWNIIPGFKDKKNSRLLQYDAIYFKSKK